MITLDEKKRIARKEHICNFCGLPILKGDKYDWQKYVFDGVLYVWKSHEFCLELVSKLNMMDYADEGVTDEAFREYINEEYYQINPEEDTIPCWEIRLLKVRQKYGVG